MFFLILFFVSSMELVIGIDASEDKFRVAIPNSSKTVFFLSPFQTNLNYFPTTLEITSKNGEPVPETIQLNQLKNLDYRWIDENESILHPESTIEHPTHFIAKLSTKTFLQQCSKRKYFLSKSRYKNAFHMTAGILPQVVTSLVLKRIANTVFDDGGELQKTVIAVPKFWVQAQREDIYYPAKKLKMNPLIIDSSTAIAFFLARKYKSLIDEHPHRILAIDIGTSYAQAIVYEYGRNRSMIGVEKFYTWSDSVGGRDFDVSIADLIQKQTRTDSDPKMNAKRMKEAEKVRKLLSKKEDVSGEFEGATYTITRKMVESACQDSIRLINELIYNVFENTNNIEIDIVELVGEPCKFFVIQNMMKKTFGTNRLHMSEHPDEVIARGSAFLFNHETTCETIGLYDVVVKQENSETIFQMKTNLKNGPVKISISEDNIIPIGAPEIILWANATSNTSVYSNPSHIIKLENPNKKLVIPWLAETMQFCDIIYSELFMKQRIEFTRTLFGYELGNFTQDLEESEILDEVISKEERADIVKEMAAITKWYEEELNKSTNLTEFLIAENKLNNIMTLPIMKKENRMFLESSVEKMKAKISKVYDDIKGIAELIGDTLSDECVELLIKPIVQTTIWFEEKTMKQKTRDTYQMPVLWWFELERKINALDILYKQISKKILALIKENK